MGNTSISCFMAYGSAQTAIRTGPASRSSGRQPKCQLAVINTSMVGQATASEMLSDRPLPQINGHGLLTGAGDGIEWSPTLIIAQSHETKGCRANQATERKC